MKNLRILVVAGLCLLLIVGAAFIKRRVSAAPPPSLSSHSGVAAASPVPDQTEAKPGATPPAVGAPQHAANRLLNDGNLDRRTQRPGREGRLAELAESRAQRHRAAERLEAMVPGAHVDFDETLELPKFIASNRGFLATPDGTSGAVPATRLAQFAPDDPARIVKAFLNEHAALIGQDAAVLEDASLLRDDTTQHNGMHTFVWQQKLDGVPIFESTLQANVTKDGSLINVASRLVPDPAGAAPDHAAQLAAPAIQPRQAIAAAGRSVGESLTAEQVGESSQPEGVTHKQSFRSVGLLEVTAEKVWLPVDEADLHLAWQVTFVSKGRAEMFRTLVDAQTGEVLLRHRLTEYISNASYRVFTSDSPSPMSPGLSTPGTTQPPLVARTLVTLQAFDTTASPNGWIDDGGNQTLGNNVDAHLDLNADDVADLPRPQGTNRVFDFSADLTQNPSTYRDAAVTNLFYWCNYVHDRYYQLGFTESAGNFQTNNFGKGGLGNDAVQADAQDGSGTNNANFSTPADGSAGRMQMYVFTGPTPQRDGDFDQEVVLHEYTHGLSNRLIGGGVGISALQPRGMGEGWSDFYALCLLSQSTDDPNAVYACGAYASYQLSGLTQNYYYGIRRYPYCTDLTKNPLTLKDIDPAQISVHTGVPKSPIAGGTADEVHNQGEVWCVTLWDVRANLIAKLGGAAGNDMAMQLVTDGMKLSPANPTFLQARDAILQAELVKTGGANRNELWKAFAKRGMGASATSPASSTTAGVVESYDLPDNLGITPSAPVNATSQIGGASIPASHVYTLTNSGTTSLNWSATVTQPWLSLSASSGTLAPGGTVNVTVTLNATSIVTAGSYSGAANFLDVTSGATISRYLNLTVTPPVISNFSLDTDPGWTRTGQWAFGHPTGGGAVSYGYPDPANGATGTNVFGVNLAGDYSTTIGGPYLLTTGALNLTGYTGTILQFKRWLNSDYQPWVYDTIEVSNNGTTWTQVWNNGATPIADSSWTTVSYDISAVADNHSTVYVRWGYQVYQSGAFAYSGWNIDDVQILGTQPNNLTITLPTSTKEGDSPFTGTITAQPAPTSALVVSLTSTNPGRLSVPVNVTIPAGATSANFTVTPIDDGFLNGPETVTVTPSAVGWTPHGTSIVINDNETSTLSITLPASATEGDGSVTGTITVPIAPTKDITVQLSSNLPGEALPPSTVTLLAGHTSATFALAIIDDTRIDGTQAVTITAAVPSWTSGSTVINVLDNETRNLGVTLPVSVREGDTGKTGSVTLTGTLTSDLLVSLSSNNTGKITVPASVTIPAGQTSATFALTVIDNTLADGTQTAVITASAAGFTNGQGSLPVLDNDADHFAIAAIPSPQVRGAAFPISITAQDVNNIAITNYTGSLTLSASAGGSNIAITPTTTGAFVNGVWTGSVTISTFGTGVVVKATDSGGHTGSSNSFDVSSSTTVDHFAWGSVASPQVMDTPFPISVTAQDIGNNPVTSFNASANLSALISVPNSPTGTGTYTASYPFYGYYAQVRSQSVYLASEVGGAGRLTGLSVNVNSAYSLQPFSKFTIRLKTTSASTQTSSWDASGWTVVYQAAVTPSATGWLTFNFTTPFDYDGASNLLVDLSFNNATSGSSYAYLTSSYLPNRSIYGYTSAGVDPLTWSGVSGSYPYSNYYLPNLQFTAERPVPIRPASAAFSGGTLAANVSVPFASTSVRLNASDTLGHSAGSNNFAVNAPAGPSGSGATVFAEDFESGVLGSAWALTGTNTYRTQVTTANSPHGGLRHLTMDSSVDSSYERNEATLTLNLAGRTNVVLNFWGKMFDDEPDGPPASPFLNGADFDGVAISADGGTTWYEVQSLRSPTITDSWSAFTVNLDAAIAAHALTYSANFKIRFNHYDNFTIPTDGIAIDDILITAAPLSGITLSVPAQVTEGAGVLSGTVTLAAAQGSDVTIALASNAPAKITVPASVVVPAGQTSATFNFTVLDDTVLDGPKTVSLTATAAGINPGSASILVLDNETGSIAVTLPASVSESAGSVQGTVTLSSAPSGTVSVALSSGNTTSLQVPSSVTFAPGQTSANFTATVINNTAIDGNRNVTVTGSVTGWTSGSATIQVLDDETRTLYVYSLYPAYEGTTESGEVELSGTLTTPLVVTLTSSNPSRLTVPATVTIPAGSQYGYFTATFVNDNLPNGTQSVTVTASASTFTSGSETVAVEDATVHHFNISTIANPQKTGVPFTTTIYADDVNGSQITSFYGTATLTAAGDGGPESITPTTITFSYGSWTGNVTCAAVQTNVKLTATSGTATGVSNAFAVQMSPAISVTPPSLALTLPVGGSASQNITIGNTGGGTLTWSLATSGASASVVSEGPVVAGHAAVAKPSGAVAATPTPPDPAYLYTEERQAGPPANALATLALSDALANLNANGNLVRAAIPNRYSFTEGTSSYYILDGGNDMYDGGNYLNTNLGVDLPYSDNLIVSSTLLGTGGKYFTRKLDGLWVMAADVNGLSYFEISGDLGADGTGSTDSAVLSVVRDGVTYRGFVKRVYGAGDPSVNHIVIVADNGLVTHAVSTDTNSDYHHISNLTGVTRIYDLLYAGTSGAYIDNTGALNIMTAFLDAIATPDWVSAAPTSGSVNSGSTQTSTLTLSAANLSAGTYTRNLLITSNDPVTPQFSLPLSLTVTPVGALQVSPSTGLTSTGLHGGTFSPASQVFTLTNSGTQTFSWTASNTAAWLTVSPTSGTLAPGGTASVTATIAPSASSLPSASYADTITLSNTSTGSGTTTRPVSLTVTPAGNLTITPAAGLVASGPPGGPFTPASGTYTLTNSGDASLNWTAAKTAAWLNLSSASGTLAAGAQTTVTASISGSTLTPGNYNDTLTFTNASNGIGNATRAAALTVALPAPVLAAEPPITPATSNTVSWNAVSGADAYEVQAATDSGFTNPISSGWITATSYTFTGLMDSTQYYYRVHSRHFVSGQTGAWSQTSQTDFAADTVSNVSTTATPGSVLLYYQTNGTQLVTENFNETGTAWSSTIFSDAPLATFTRGVLSAGPNTTPALPVNQASDPAARAVTGTAEALRVDTAANRFADGYIDSWIAPENRNDLSHAGLVLRASRGISGVNGYAAVILFFANGTASADFARIVNGAYATTTNWFYTKTTSFTVGAQENVHARFAITGSTLTLTLWRVAVSGGVVVETPIAFFGGTNVLTATDTTYTAAGLPGLLEFSANGVPLLFDDVSISEPGPPAYLPSGTLTSTLIAPTPNQRWGLLQYNGDTSLSGTALTVDVLNSAGALLAANVASGTDLNSIPAVAGQPSLRLRANLSTSNTTVSPRLDDWTVGYYTSLDQTFLSAWSATENSTQFNAPPSITAIADQTIPANASTALLSFSLGDDTTLPGNLVVTATSSDPVLLPSSGILLTGTGADRSIRVTPAAGLSGSGTVTVRALDEGGKFTDRTLHIAVYAVNIAPTFVRGADQTVFEGSGLHSISGWATAMSAGPATEAGQALNFLISTDHPELFSSAPTLSPQGALTFTPAPGANGIALVTVRLHDDGGTAYGGHDTSAPQLFAITIMSVNSAPSFVKGQDQTVLEDAGPISVPGWARQIGAGPADESTQSLNFLVTCDHPAFFSAGPSVSPDGTLTFTPAPDAFGAALVSVRLHDDGGTANGGIDTSAAQTFTITITAVNDPPTLAPIADLTLTEGSPAHTVLLTGIGTGAANEFDTLTVTATSDHPELIPNPAVTYVSPQSGGSLTLQPVSAKTGSATITVVVDDGQAENHAITRTFKVTLATVNQAPSFTKGADLTVNEDSGPQTVAWATDISAGPAEEAGQTVHFLVSAQPAALFSTPPALTPDGTLTFTPAQDANGRATVTVKLQDDGGTGQGGVDTSAEQTFTITVNPVNDAPSFTKGPDQHLSRHAGMQIMPAWATNLLAGPADERGQTLNFLVTNDRPDLFAIPPTISPEGTLTFTPAGNLSGTATVTVQLHDSGGVERGGVDTSPAQTFQIVLASVNAAPSFTKGPDEQVAQDGGVQSFPAWAQAISAGPAEESSQLLDFRVTTDHPEFFDAVPSIGPDGTLTFTPRAAASGNATVTVRLHDDGGVTDGGVDTSAPQTFTITLTTAKGLQGTYNGLISAVPGDSISNEQFGTIQVVLAKTGAFSATVKLAEFTFSFHGTFDGSGNAHFLSPAADARLLHRSGNSDLTLRLQLDVSQGTNRLTGTLDDGDTPFATLAADRSLYVAAANPKPPQLAFPAALAGKYTIIIPAPSPADQSVPASDYPQGNGVGLLTVSAGGLCKLTGTLADGTAISCANALSQDFRWPFYVSLAGRHGSISGEVGFRETDDVSDLDGPDLSWFMPAAANTAQKRYPAGWPTGLKVKLLGSKYVVPEKSLHQSVLPGLPVSANPTSTAAAAANAQITMEDGDLADPGLTVTADVTPANKVTIQSPTTPTTLTINPANGALSGSFLHPTMHKRVNLKGVIFQKQQLGCGFFLGPTESGYFSLTPAQSVPDNAANTAAAPATAAH